MRISELCSLKPLDIDLESNNILIYGKGAKERVIQIGNKEVIAALKLYKKTFEKDMDSCGYFFVNRLQHKLSDQSIIMLNWPVSASISHPICSGTPSPRFCWNRMLISDISRGCLGTVPSVQQRFIRMCQVRSKRRFLCINIPGIMWMLIKDNS